MGGREDLIESLRAIMASREASGESPSPEELVAYRDGRLDPARHAALEARLEQFPDAARALADLESFPEVAPAPGTEEPDAEEVRAGWADFQRRLDERRPPRRDAEHGEPPPTSAPTPTATPRPWTAYLGRAAAAVALLATGLLFGFLLARDVPTATVNDTVVELRPVEERRLRTAVEGLRRVELAPNAGHLVLLLAVTDPGDFDDYSILVESGDGRELLDSRGLRPDRHGTFRVTLPVRALDAERLRLVLSGHEGGAETVLAIYAVALERPADRHRAGE